MKTTIDRLTSLRVSDVMNRQVVQVGINDSMAQAAELMLNNEVSGAPVVDAANRCVGILSAIDFMRREQQQHGTEQPALQGQPHVLEHSKPHAPWAMCDVNEHVVERHMSSAVQSIFASATLVDAAERMCRAHVHRLPVLDSQGRVVGIISSLDIVAAVIKVVEEAKS